MSTIDRARTRWRSLRTQQRALTARALRVRNLLVRQAAARLGLVVPNHADLSALSDRVSLLEAVAWWQMQSVAAAADLPSRSGPGHLVVKVACITALALFALALSPGEIY